MLFPESDASLLKAWIIKRLANTSDADADVLADYVLALLRHDGDMESIRKIFEEEIPDFLREDSAAFTDDVFQAIMYQSYRPGAPPAPPSARHTLSRLPPPADVSIPSQYQPQLPYGAPPIAPAFGQNGSRKRAYDDRDDNDVNIILNGQGSYNGAPSYKQPRRGGGFGQRGGRSDDSYAARDPQPFTGPYPTPVSSRYLQTSPAPYQPAPYQPPQNGQGMPLMDPNVLMQQLGLSIPPMPELPKPTYSGAMPAPRRRRQRCRDYDTNGYCARGHNCRFEHGTGPPIMPTVPPSVNDEYDPNKVFTIPQIPQIPQMPPMNNQPQNQTFQHSNMPSMPPFPMMPPTNRRESRGPRRAKGRPLIASNGPSNDKTKTTIVVQNIPNDHFTEEQIRRYFSQFGDITEVSMLEHDRLATIKFETWDAAHAAWSSPKVIFDNRFVKVFWQKEDTDGQAPLANGKHGNSAKNETSNGSTTGADSASAEPFDMDEFMRKQEEAQKAHEEKTKKRQEVERQRQELEERQKELVARQLEEKRKLQAKIAAKSVKNTPEPTTDTNMTDGNDKKPTSQTEALRAQLAALEEEANVLGIDPNAVQNDPSFRGRGRGTRGFHARGTYPPRASRGSYGYRGRGGIQARHAAYAVFSLDNRPKIVVLSGVDFTNSEKDEALRQYLFGIGEFQEIHSEPSATHITFKDRKTAEQFMFGISANNTIPGLDDKVEITWATSAPQSAAKSTNDGDVTMASGIEDEQAAKDKADAQDNNHTASGLEEGEVDDARGRDQGDMDFEAGEDWGIS